MDFPTGTVTFLFTDIETSTHLLQSIGEEAFAALLAEHHAILRAAIASHSGKEVDTQGDALFAVFPRAPDAVSASVSAQRALAEHSRSTGTELRVRMGLHTGEAMRGPTGYVGLDIHRAARISHVGHGGQVLVSESTAALVRNELPPGVTLQDLGSHRLKDLAFPERISQLVIAGLVSEFPPLTSLDLVPNNLPVQLTTFVGRQRETAKLTEWLCPVQEHTGTHDGPATTRLLTLTGTGGTGKTRLALEVAAELVKEFPDGVWLVELAPLADPALVPQAIASVLGVREQPGRALLDSIVDSLRAKRALLILDNCEHLIDTAALIADKLLRAAPGVRILATSREALGIAGETSFRVPSLALPDAHARSVEDIASRESVQLFLSRATAIQPNFQLTAQNSPAVAQIVRRLDGIPLAIELAAARSKLFSAEQIAARLDDHFRLLTGGSRTALPRQQTLRALIDWSYDLLSPEECALLRRLSVFAGGCTYEAIEAVAGHDLDVLDLLERLVDKSLVLAEEQEASTRYRLLEMIRQYGRDKLRESGEAEAVRNRHLDYYAELATGDVPFVYMATGLARFKALRTEADNVRAAMAWGLEIKAEKVLDIVTGFGGYWRRAGLLVEGIDWVERTITTFDLSRAPDGESTERTRARARVYLILGMLQFEDGRSVPARAALQTGVELFRALRDNAGLGASLGMLSLVDLFLGNNDACLEESAESATLVPKTGYTAARIALLTGRSRIAAQLLHDLPMARAFADEAVALARGENDPWLLAMPLMASGMVGFAQGDYATAHKALVEAMDIYREQEDAHGCNMVRSSLAEVMRAQGDLNGAARMYGEIIPNWIHMGQLGGTARSLECLGFVALAQASQADDAASSAGLARAAQLFGAAEKLRETSGAVMMPQEREEYDRETATLRSRMQPEELTQAWERGRSLSLDQAVLLARAG